jgi:dGTPase
MFTLDSTINLAEKMWGIVVSGSAAFLGAPTVGFHYAHSFGLPTTILDVDQDIIDSLILPACANKICYGVSNSIPESLKGIHKAVLIDPPWYPEITDLFLSRALDLVQQDGFILCVIPSRLTRPGLIQERTLLLKRLLQANFEVVALESGFISYRVPQFELNAYGDIDSFSGRQWRKGDLLILRVRSNTVFAPHENIELDEPFIFSRNPRIVRFFLEPSRVNASLHEWVSPVELFENSVSTREFNKETITIWGTNKKAATLREFSIAKQIMEHWANGESQENTISALIDAGVPDLQNYVAALNNSLKLWDTPSGPYRRRTPVQLVEYRTMILSDLASRPTIRIYPFENDGFRIDFQRDRDRILWSNALKRLANKTQLFPVSSDDHLRRRLTHSIEVMQLASTIAVSFGLDRDLTEAGALAHDIGHSPFGHAGEFSLDHVINEIDLRLGGFNHYEHGVDMARWIENVYRSPGVGGFPGLNLTKETIECIFKHTFDRENGPLSQSSLVRSSKHKDLDDTSCHLEGQAVRIADKISYLISDLEDGIRMGAITYYDLMACKFFERAPIDMEVSSGESLFERFISQRRSILKVLMEDILNASDERLVRLDNLQQVRTTREYLIDYSSSIKKDVAEIWNKLQAGKLHHHPAVVVENGRAARIVRDLFLGYMTAPRLVSPSFRDSYLGLADTEYISWYENKIGKKVGVPKRLLLEFSYEHTLGSEPISQGDNFLIDTFNLVMAKDYVASLTDTTAIEEHRKHFLESA